MKLILLNTIAIGFALFLAQSLNAQQIVATTGGSLQSSSGSVSYTLGELVIDTRSTTSGAITQGFHQPKITITAVNELSGLDITAMVCPNPASDVVKLKVDKAKPFNMEYAVFELNGKLLFKNKIESVETEIPFNQLAPSVYIIKIQVDGKCLKTFKIVKQ